MESTHRATELSIYVSNRYMSKTGRPFSNQFIDLELRYLIKLPIFLFVGFQVMAKEARCIAIASLKRCRL